MLWMSLTGRAFVRRDHHEVLQELRSELQSGGGLDRLLELAHQKEPGRFLERDGELLQFYGTARVGKDEAARILAEQNMQSYSFALPIKYAAQMLFGLSDTEAWDESVKEKPLEGWGITPRKIYQRLGTEGGRKVFKNEMWGERAALQFARILEGKSIAHPLLAEQSEGSIWKGEDGQDWVVQQSTNVLMGFPNHEWEWSPVLAMQKLLNESLPAILEGTGFSVDDFWKIRMERPVFSKLNQGPFSFVDNPTGMVTPDVRFEDEASIIRGDFHFSRPALNDLPQGVVIAIQRILPDDWFEAMRKNNTIQHASEKGIAHDPRDTIVWNDGTLMDLKEKILDVHDRLNRSSGAILEP